MNKIVTVVDTFNAQVSRIVSWFTIVMVVLTFSIVVLRYGFNLGWIAMQESVMYLHAAVLLLGSAHTLQRDEHVRVDIFYRKKTPRGQAIVDFIGTLFFLIPVNLFIIIYSWRYVATSWRVMEGSPEAGGLPYVFILKSLIIAFSVLMLLQGVAELLRQTLQLKRKGEQ